MRLKETAGANTVARLRQPFEELFDGRRHGEAGRSNTDTGPATIADHGNASFCHAFDKVACEVAVARIPDPLPVGLIKGCPPLMGELQGGTHRGTTFWVVVVEVTDWPTGMWHARVAASRLRTAVQAGRRQLTAQQT
jgi:hypothetical protein